MKLVEFLNYLDDSQTVRLVASYVELDKNVKNFEHIIRSGIILEGIAGGACMIPYDNYSVFGIKFKDTDIPEILIDVDYEKLFEGRYGN
jgi:hypothetical protein